MPLTHNIAPSLPTLAAVLTPSVEVPRTLADLLNPLPTDAPKTNLLPMLRRTADLIGEYRHTSHSQVDIDDLFAIWDVVDEPDGFRVFLTGKRYKPNSIESYVNFFRILVRRAESLGCTRSGLRQSGSVAIRTAWEPILDIVSGTPHGSRSPFCGSAAIIEALMRSEQTPATATNEHLEECVAVLIRRGRSYSNARSARAAFFRLLSKHDLLRWFPKLSAPCRLIYGVAWSRFPELMRAQFEGLLQPRLAFHSRKRQKKIEDPADYG